MGLAAQFAWVLTLSLAAIGTPQAANDLPLQEARQLVAGKTLTGTIRGDQIHSFNIELNGDQYLHVVVLQRGIDLLVTLYGPDGAKLMEEDRTDAFGPEMVGGILSPAGTYRLELRPVDDEGKGKYEVLVKEVRAARAEDRAMLTEITAAFDWLEEADELRRKSEFKSAVELYQKALLVWRRFGDKYWEATTLNDLGMTHQLGDERERAVEVFKEALSIFKTIGVRSDEAAVLDNLAIAHNDVDALPDQRKQALDYFNQELEILREIKARSLEVKTLNNIGLIYMWLANHQKSRELFNSAVTIAQSVKDREGEAKSYYNLGLLYFYLNENRKALEHYEQALATFEALGNKAAKSKTIHSMGGVYHALGEFQTALGLYQQSLQLDRFLGNTLSEGGTLNDIGGIYSDLGDKAKALEYYDQALAFRRAARDRRGEASTLNNIGAVYETLGQIQKALEFYNQALTITRMHGDRDSEATTLNNLGFLYRELGDSEKALEFYQQAFELFQALSNRSGVATALSNMGLVHEELGDQRKAAEFFMRARLLHREIGDRGGEATTLSNMGGTLYDLGESAQALDFLNQALALYEALGDDEGIANTLNGIGTIYSEMGQRQKALAAYNKAIVLNRAIGNVGGEAVTLGNLAAEWKAGKPSLAIFYAKQVINVYQTLRGNIQGLDKEQQKSYLSKVEPAYRFLADLLISEGRLGEALQTLNLFKDQQFFDFNREPQKPASTLWLTPREADLLTAYLQTTGKLAAVAKRVRDEELAKTDEKELLGMREQVKVAVAEFQSLLVRIETEMSRRDAKDQPAEIADSRELQTALCELKVQTNQSPVAIYTLLGEEKFHALVVTPEKITAASHVIPSKTLNGKALQFWALLQSDKYDPTLLSQQLYADIFKPLESQLPKDTKTILWSLDSNLRYLPMGALHDGTRYLIERYNHVVFTRADRERLLRNVSPHWTGLGLGSSQAHTVELLGERISFTALPGVSEELQALFKQKGSTTGLLEGEVLPDEKFTKESMLKALKLKRPLVHISSHFNFRPGDEARSFLLLGDGTAMTLVELKQYRELFAGVELLTLSACNTAAQQAGANGKEIDGFAELAQRLGAGSVMATLWPVADNSTPWLMHEFYERRQGGGITKAEAIRLAQLALLSGTAKAEALAESRKGSTSTVEVAVTRDGIKGNSSGTRAKVVYVSEKNAPPFKRVAEKPFAHPHYWAPFILIGNWK